MYLHRHSAFDSHRLRRLVYSPRAQILERFAPIMTEQADEMVRQVGAAAAGGNEFDIFERITRAALVRLLRQHPSALPPSQLLTAPAMMLAVSYVAPNRTPFARYAALGAKANLLLQLTISHMLLACWVGGTDIHGRPAWL